MLVHHSVTLRHVCQNFSTPKRSTNFDGNTPSAIGIGRVCVVTFRFETAVIQTCRAASIWYICLGGSTRPQHQPTSGIYLFRLVGELQWISTHRNRGFRPQNHTLAPSPRAVAHGAPFSSPNPATGNSLGVPPRRNHPVPDGEMRNGSFAFKHGDQTD